MSETPRTSAILTQLLDSCGYLDQSNAPEVWVKATRQLETESADLRRKLEEATQALKRIAVPKLGGKEQQYDAQRTLRALSEGKL